MTSGRAVTVASRAQPLYYGGGSHQGSCVTCRRGRLPPWAFPGECLVLRGVCVVIIVDGNAIDQKKGSYRVRQVRSIGPRHVLAPRGFVYVPARRRGGRRPRCSSGPRGECGYRGRLSPLRRSLPSKHAVGPTMAAPNATGIVPLIPGLERPGCAMPAVGFGLASLWQCFQWCRCWGRDSGLKKTLSASCSALLDAE